MRTATVRAPPGPPGCRRSDSALPRRQWPTPASLPAHLYRLPFAGAPVRRGTCRGVAFSAGRPRPRATTCGPCPAGCCALGPRPSVPVRPGICRGGGSPGFLSISSPTAANISPGLPGSARFSTAVKSVPTAPRPGPDPTRARPSSPSFPQGRPPPGKRGTLAIFARACLTSAPPSQFRTYCQILPWRRRHHRC